MQATSQEVLPTSRDLEITPTRSTEDPCLLQVSPRPADTVVKDGLPPTRKYLSTVFLPERKALRESLYCSACAVLLPVTS